MKVAVLETAAHASTTPASSKPLVDTALGLLEEFLAADNFEGAARLLKVAQLAAPNAKSVGLLSSIQARRVEVEAIKLQR